MPSSELLPFLKKLWIPILVLGLSPLFAEGAYRLAGVRVAGTVEGVFERDPGGPLRHRPHASVFQTWFSGDFWVHTDAFGFRVDESEIHDRDDGRSPDLLVLGDSQTFGQGVQYPDSVIGRFEALARKAGIDVGNAAVGGHWLRDQIALVRRLVSKNDIRPRCVLVCLTPRALMNPDAGGSYARAGAQPDAGAGGGLAAVRTWLKRNSAVYLVLRNAVRSDEGRERSWNDLRRMYDPSAAEERTERLQLRLTELSESFDGPAPRIVYCYLPFEPGFHIRQTAEQQGDAAGIVDPLAPRGILGRAVQLNGAPLVDVTGVLEGRMHRSESVTLRGDAHYNQETSRACGEHIWKAVDWVALSRTPSKKGD